VRSFAVWVRAERAAFLCCPSENEIVPMERSIVGKCLDSQKMIAIGDPSHHEAFDFDYDLPLFRDTVSMVLLPVVSDLEDQLGVIQCLDWFDEERNVRGPFPKYAIRILRILRTSVKKLLARHFERKVKVVEPEMCDLMLNFRPPMRISNLVVQGCEYLAKKTNCETADGYQYFEEGRILIDLKNGTEYRDISGGIAYRAVTKNQTIFLGHGFTHRSAISDIDAQLVNWSALAHPFLVDTQVYVFVTRAKFRRKSFLPEDVGLLKAIGGIIAEWISIVSQIYGVLTAKSKVDRLMHVEHCALETLGQFVSDDPRPWETISRLAHDLFGSEKCFIAAYDRFMVTFLPTAVRWRSDDCVAGEAYNFREVMWLKPESRLDVYDELGVDCHRSVAFPLWVRGTVKGALELVNLTSDELDHDAKAFLSGFSSLILDEYLTLTAASA
jgi:hypothetical protein